MDSHQLQASALRALPGFDPYLILRVLCPGTLMRESMGKSTHSFFPSYPEAWRHFFGGSSWESNRTISCGPLIARARLEVFIQLHMNLVSSVLQTGHTGEFLDCSYLALLPALPDPWSRPVILKDGLLQPSHSHGGISLLLHLLPVLLSRRILVMVLSLPRQILFQSESS